MSDSPRPAHAMAIPAHPEATDGDQTVVIAHMVRGRAALKYGAGFLFCCFALWVLLQPVRDAHQVLGIICAGILLLMFMAGFAMWFSRGRRTAITLKGDRLYLPIWESALDDVITVRTTIWKNPDFDVPASKYIEIDRRGGNTVMVAYTDLQEDGDVVIARLNDALARHRAAAPPAASA